MSVSAKVGWAAMVRAMSSALPPYSIWATAGAMSSEAWRPMIWTPRSLSVLASAMTLTMPSLASEARARPLAAKGNLPVFTLRPLSLASCSLMPTLASSGSV